MYKRETVTKSCERNPGTEHGGLRWEGLNVPGFSFKMQWGKQEGLRVNWHGQQGLSIATIKECCSEKAGCKRRGEAFRGRMREV